MAGEMSLQPGPQNPTETQRRRPLARAAVKSAVLLVIATALAYTGNMLDNVDPDGTGPGPYHGLTRLLFLLIAILVVAAVVIVGSGVACWLELRRSRSGMSHW